MGKKVTTSDFFNEAVKDILNIESLCVPPITGGQQSKNFLLEDIRWCFVYRHKCRLKEVGIIYKPYPK